MAKREAIKIRVAFILLGDLKARSVEVCCVLDEPGTFGKKEGLRKDRINCRISAPREKDFQVFLQLL